MIHVQNVSKTFVLHQQNGVRLPVLQNASLEVGNGECVVLHGHSGSGKSTLLRSLYANYLPDEGHIHIRHNNEWVDLVQAPARKVLEVRRSTIPIIRIPSCWCRPYCRTEGAVAGWRCAYPAYEHRTL